MESLFTPELTGMIIKTVSGAMIAGATIGGAIGFATGKLGRFFR